MRLRTACLPINCQRDLWISLTLHLFDQLANQIAETHWWMNKETNLISIGCLLSYSADYWTDYLGRIIQLPISNWILSSSKRRAPTLVLLEPWLMGFLTLLYCNAYYTKFFESISCFQICPSLYAKTWAPEPFAKKASWHLPGFHVDFRSFCWRIDRMF